MSQNDNLYSAFKRPRETMAGFTSSIPQPASALRRSNSGSAHPLSMPPPRMSMAPRGAQTGSFHNRVSSAGTPDVHTSALKSARKSYAPGSSSLLPPQQPPPSSVRRSSSYSRPSGAQFSGGHSFFSQSIPISGVVKDPRPLKDRNWLARIAGEILDYLAANNFEAETKHQISANFLKSPTQKDFNMVFEYLYHKLDPNYHFTKSMDQEVLPILKTLRYPYSSSITKSALAAVGGANSWPTFLAMLHWLLDLVRTMERVDSPELEAQVEDEIGIDMGSDRIIFDFTSRSYQSWLQGSDDDQEFVEEMVAAFDERVARYANDVEELELRNEELRARLKELNPANDQGKTPLQILEDQRKILEKDKEKFVAYIQDIEGRIKKTSTANVRLRDKLQDLDVELTNLEEEKQALQRAVDKQGLSPADIDRMNGERQKLETGLTQTSARIAELKVKAAEREQDAASKLEYLERAVSRYNTLAYQIGITPPNASNAGDDDPGVEDPRLLYDSVTGYQPAQLVNRDLRHDIKPALNKLRQEIGDRIHQLQEEGFKGHELIDRVTEALSDLKEEVETLKARVAAAQTELEGIKETMTAESNASNTEIEKLERELQSLRIGMNSGVLSLDQRLQSVTIEYDQLEHAADALRQELHGEVERALSDIIKFKVHIQEGLGEYEKRLEDEVANALSVIDE
ncbi:HEC/Ndc80p family-domain-containing protein [Kalaharituber pfeilii]|nr:HEC/Ndc80p family-domain-containing protein [Kalaharituber pfeilii]